MKEIISSIDIGSDSIKLIVGEYFENRLHILNAIKVPHRGLERGKFIDEDDTVNAIKKAIEETRAALDKTIDRCILTVDMYNAKLTKSAYAIKIKNENGIITPKDVDEIQTKCADGKISEDNALIGVIPVEYTIDGDEVVENPIGRKSENLGLKAIVVSSPRDYVGNLLEVSNKAGLKIIDVVPSALGDYSVYRTHSRDEEIGVIVNLGLEMTSISIFNRGILTNTKTIPFGAGNIIRDISFVAKIGNEEAKAVFNDIVLANSRLANPNEYSIVTDLDGDRIKLNQYDMSEIASSRIDEMLNLVKKQINILTKKEIRYIIVTGGLTELKDFNLSLERSFGKNAEIGKLNLLGARDNSFSSAAGSIECFAKKLEFKGKSYSMLKDDDEESYNNEDNSLLSKVFGYFFDN